MSQCFCLSLLGLAAAPSYLETPRRRKHWSFVACVVLASVCGSLAEHPDLRDLDIEHLDCYRHLPSVRSWQDEPCLLFPDGAVPGEELGTVGPEEVELNYYG